MTSCTGVVETVPELFFFFFFQSPLQWRRLPAPDGDAFVHRVAVGLVLRRGLQHVHTHTRTGDGQKPDRGHW